MSASTAADPKTYMSVLRRAYGKHYRDHTDEWTGDPAMRCAPVLAQAYLRLPSSAHVLDVGCGAGCDVAYLAGLFEKVAGIDIVPQPSWDAIVQRYGSTVTFTATDLLSYEPRERYDLVLDNGCFHHQHEDEHVAYLRKAGSLLAPGGWFVLSTFKNPLLEERVDGNGRIHRFFADHELHETLDAARLAVVREHDIPRPLRDDHYRLSFCRTRA